MKKFLYEEDVISFEPIKQKIKKKKPNPSDKCRCGSGKKFKDCCYEK